MESQLSNIFRVKLVAKNTVLGPPVDHLMHLRINLNTGKNRTKKFQIQTPFV